MIIGISGRAGSGKDTAADFLVREYGFVKVSLADELKRICMRVFDFSEEQLWGPSEKRNEPDARYVRARAGYDKNGRPLDVCSCAGQFMDAEHYRDHLPCPKVAHKDDCLTPRFALQTLGTEWGRACYENVWVEYTLRVARQLLNEPDLEYDARTGTGYLPFSNNRYKGVVVPDVRFKNEIEGLRKGGAKLVRVKRPGAGLQGAAGAHASETEQDEVPDSAFDFVIENDGSLEDLQKKICSLLA